jgi:hypothetical protein
VSPVNDLEYLFASSGPSGVTGYLGSAHRLAATQGVTSVVRFAATAPRPESVSLREIPGGRLHGAFDSPASQQRGRQAAKTRKGVLVDLQKSLRVLCG